MLFTSKFFASLANGCQQEIRENRINVQILCFSLCPVNEVSVG